jgi:hypothetical protein
MKEMYESFYEIELPKSIYDTLPHYKLTPAKVSSVLFQYFDDPKEAITALMDAEISI